MAHRQPVSYTVYNMYKKSAFAALVLSLVFAASTASAATELVAAQSPSVTAVVISDVNLSDLHVTAANGTISGDFTLQSRQGSQSAVVYGIVATGANGSIQAITPLGSVDILRKMELKKEQFSYTIPKYLAGKVSFNLTAQTATGLPIGNRQLATLTLSGSPTLSCAHTSSQTSSIVCTTKSDRPLAVAYYRSLFAKPFLEETLAPVQKKITIDNKELPAGQWYVIVTDTATGEEQMSMHAVEGAYGTIQGVMIDTADGALSVHVTARKHGISGAAAVITLKNGSTNCGEARIPFSGPVAVATLASSCTQGAVRVTLEDADKKVFDTFTTSFTTVAYNPSEAVTPPIKAPVQSPATLLIAGAILILLIGALTFLYRKYRKDSPLTTLVLLFVAASLSMMVPAKTHALLYVAYIGSCPGSSCDGDVEMPWECDIDINTDKSSYSRGDSLTITAGSNLWFDRIGHPSGTGNCDLGLREVSPGVPAYGTDPGTVYESIIDQSLVYRYEGPDSNWLVGTYSTVVPNGPLNGAYFTVKFTLTGGVSSGWNKTPWSPAYPTISFTLNDPPLPPPPPYCGWIAKEYINGRTNPGKHNSVKCETPNPGDGTPNESYCNSVSENKDLTVCCDTGADCYKYECYYPSDSTCTPPTPTVNIHF